MNLDNLVQYKMNVNSTRENIVETNFMKNKEKVFMLLRLEYFHYELIMIMYMLIFIQKLLYYKIPIKIYISLCL